MYYLDYQHFFSSVDFLKRVENIKLTWLLRDNMHIKIILLLYCYYILETTTANTKLQGEVSFLPQIFIPIIYSETILSSRQLLEKGLLDVETSLKSRIYNSLSLSLCTPPNLHQCKQEYRVQFMFLAMSLTSFQ